jgi:hypothetical protein
VSRSSLIILSTLLAGCSGEMEPFAQAYVIEDLSQAIGGPKAIARPGDFVIENDEIRVAIIGARNSYGPNLYGGSIVDADLQRFDPRSNQGRGNDIFSEMFTTANLNIMQLDAETGSIEIPAEHPYGDAAVVRVTAPAAGFLSLLDALWALVQAPDLQLVTDYVLAPDSRYLRMITTVTYGEVDPATEGEPMNAMTADDPLLEYAIESGLVVGDLFLSGGSLDVFAPGIGFDEDLAVQEANAAGQNLFLDPFEVDWLVSTGDGTSYGYASLEGPMYIPMFSSNQTAGITHGMAGEEAMGNARFPSGTAMSAERIFAIGEGDVGSVLDVILEARGTPTGRISGTVIEQTTGEPLSDVHVFAYQGHGAERASRPWAEWQTDVGRDVRDDGSFGGLLPEGAWTLMAHEKGRAHGEALEIEIVQGDELSVTLDLPMPGFARFEVVDEDGRAVPAKVTVYARPPTETTRDSVLGDGYQPGNNVTQVFHTSHPVEVQLPVGEYYAVASRGPEYELGTSPYFMVSDHDTTTIQLQVVQVVDSSGWIAADLHVHSDTSFDAGTSKYDRLASMMAEQVEFFPSTDHDYITDYAPTLEAMGWEPWITQVAGVEVSPMEMGHFIGWPQRSDFLAEGAGAFEWTDMEPEEIFDAIRANGPPGYEPLVTVAHPHDGILGYFDQFGMNPYGEDDGEVLVERPMLAITNDLLTPDNFSMEFELLELFNSYRMDLLRAPTQQESDLYRQGQAVTPYAWVSRTMEEQRALIDGETTLGYNIFGQVDSWFTLLNLGYRITAVGSSDTHSPKSTPSGQPRTWVMSPTDSPAYLDPGDIAQALREHRAVASYGPFVRFEADGQPIGSEISTDGAVELFIEVQSPSWFECSQVEVYENGTLIEVIEIPSPNTTPVNLSTTLEVMPNKDSWYALVVVGDDDLDPVYPSLDRENLVFQDVVTEALGSMPSLSAFLSEAPPRPRKGPMIPYALTNPIWVDVGGDGWDAPGLPEWMSEPVDPAG